MDWRRQVSVWALLLLMAGAGGPAFSQVRSDLQRVRQERTQTEQELQNLEEQLQKFESELTAAQRAEQTAAQRIAEIDKEIQMREQLLSTYVQRKRQLEAEVAEVTERIETAAADYDAITHDYQRRVIHAYKHGRGVYLAMILSAESLDRIFARVRYLRRFTQQRRGRVSEIQSSTGDLDTRKHGLEEAIAQNEELLQKERGERQRLASLKADRERILDQSRQQRTTIESEITQARREAEELQSRISELIAAEAQRIKAVTEGDPLAAAEFAEIASRFQARKGALSWPASGNVTEPFGTRVHPVYKTETLNPGIEIATQPGAVVKSVFDGQVTRIFFLPGYGTCVTIRHGSHTSMYANLSDVQVANQQRVTAGQILGEAGTSAEPRGEALFFAVFTEDGNAVDPTEWLRPR